MISEVGCKGVHELSHVNQLVKNNNKESGSGSQSPLAGASPVSASKSKKKDISVTVDDDEGGKTLGKLLTFLCVPLFSRRVAPFSFLLRVPTRRLSTLFFVERELRVTLFMTRGPF